MEKPQEMSAEDGESAMEILDKIYEEMKDLLTSAETLLLPDEDDESISLEAPPGVQEA